MVVSTGVSLVLSLSISILLFSAMQLYKSWFVATQINTILGGYIGSWLFIFYLTAVSNLESVMFGKDFQSKFFPEIAFCLLASVAACGMVHRVCASTCVIFSFVALYFVNNISQKFHNIPVPVEVTSKKKRK